MSTTSFSEHEKRFLLAEIIKTSKVSIDTLLGIIKKEHIEPDWSEIFIPPARNLKACAAVFEELVSSSPAVPHPHSGFEPVSKPTLKRRLSDTEPAPGVTRTLHPKPAANGAQFAPLPSPADPTSKKRGRPTKEVLDARRAEAAARGTMYPPLKAAGRKSMGESPLPPLSFGSQGPASEPGPKTGGSSDSPSAKKRRGRPPKEATEPKQPAEPAPQATESPKVPFEGSKDVSHHTADVLEVVERAQDPPSSATASGTTVQGVSEFSQPQPAAHPPPGQ